MYILSSIPPLESWGLRNQQEKHCKSQAGLLLTADLQIVGKRWFLLHTMGGPVLRDSMGEEPHVTWREARRQPLGRLWGRAAMPSGTSARCRSPFAALGPLLRGSPIDFCSLKAVSGCPGAHQASSKTPLSKKCNKKQRLFVFQSA